MIMMNIIMLLSPHLGRKETIIVFFFAIYIYIYIYTHTYIHTYFADDGEHPLAEAKVYYTRLAEPIQNCGLLALAMGRHLSLWCYGLFKRLDCMFSLYRLLNRLIVCCYAFPAVAPPRESKHSNTNHSEHNHVNNF